MLVGRPPDTVTMASIAQKRRQSNIVDALIAGL